MSTIQGIECEFIFTHDNLASDGSKIQAYLILNYSIGTYKITKVNGQPFNFFGFNPNDAIFLAQIIEEAAVFAEDKLISWTAQTSGVTEILNDSSYGSSKYIVVGQTGTILSSSNGTTWNSETLGASTTLYKSEFAEGLFIVGGDNFLIYSSPDGITWTIRTSSITGVMLGIIHGDMFMAVGEKGAAESAIFTSSDGLTWVEEAVADVGRLRGVTFDGISYFIVGDGGGVWETTDGVTLTPKTSGVAVVLRDIDYGNNIYVAVGEAGTIIMSEDGDNWVDVSPSFITTIRAVHFDGSKFTAVGSSGKIVSSQDGVNWAEEDSGTANSLNGISSGIGNIAVGSGGTVLTKGIIS